MRRLSLAAALLVALAALGGSASANGRAPGVSSLHFRTGHPNDIAAGLTFGLVISHDSGATWHWLCEDAIGYGGTYDPDYVWSADGSLFATSFDGARVSRDGCVFDLLSSVGDVNFFSSITESPNGTLLFAAAQTASGSMPGNSLIYRSTNDGESFDAGAGPGVSGDWWSSIEVAPSDAQRVYASGYRFVDGAKVIFLYRSLDGGATYEPLPTTDFTLMPSSKLHIGGISATDPNKVYARVEFENNATVDALYGSVNGGQTWTRLFSVTDKLVFLARSNGDLIAGGATVGLSRSTNNGLTWTPLAGAPHANCLAENPAHEVWACTSNTATTAPMPGDGFGIMKSTDLATWTGVLRFQDIQAPVACAAGTVQHDTCDRNADHRLGWCGLCAQLHCTVPADYGCTNLDGQEATTPVDGLMVTTDGGGGGGGGGCCDAGAQMPAGALLLGLGVGGFLVMGPAGRRRRRPPGA